MKRISLFVCLLIAFSCSQKSIPDKAVSLIGEWHDNYGGDAKIVFTPNGEFHRYRHGVVSKNLLLEKDSIGQLVEVDYGVFHYVIDSINGDSISCRIVGSKNGKTFRKRLFISKDNHLIEISYKTLPGIEDHIDEVTYYKRADDSISKPPEVVVDKIIIPQGYLGFIYIAYNQKDGAPEKFDTSGNRVLEVPKNGLLKTRAIENPLVLATDGFECYERDSISGQFIPLSNYQHGEFRRTAEQLRDKEGPIILKYDKDSTAMFFWGFNQAGRKRTIDKVFGKAIEGNVLSLEVDTVRERLRLDWYGVVVKD